MALPNERLSVLRGARIDIEAAYAALDHLTEEYVNHTSSADDISDAVVRDVGTIVRSLRGALDKTANEVAQRHAKRTTSTYFPIVETDSKFEVALQKNIPGLRANRSDIADVIHERQPFQPGLAVLKHLPALYRAEQHHNYNLQSWGEAPFVVLLSDGRPVFSSGPTGLILRGSEDVVLLRGTYSGEVGLGLSYVHGTVLNWTFADLGISVMPTLTAMCNICATTCRMVSDVAGI